MTEQVSRATILAIFVLLTLAKGLCVVKKKGIAFSCYGSYLWTFFLFFTIAEWVSFQVGIWVVAILSFVALREFFTLVDMRLSDRWGMWGAYLSIPFMIYYIQIDWYGMFIVSIPVYVFLVIPFLVSLGGETKGSVFSIGAIDLGLFLFVYCLGHIGYLALFSRWMAIMFLANITVCDMCGRAIQCKIKARSLNALLSYLFPLPMTLAITLSLSGVTGIPRNHSAILACMIPALVMMGHRTINHIKGDLGVVQEEMRPGRGEVIDSVRSVFYAAPVVFHYIRYFLK